MINNFILAIDLYWVLSKSGLTEQKVANFYSTNTIFY